MSFNNNLHKKNKLKHPHHAHKLLKELAITEELTCLFGVYKTGLVSYIEKYRNIQTLISKSKLNIRQHDLDTHDSITV